MTARQVEVNGRSLYVWREGAGPPFVALHGGPGLDHTSIAPWLGFVARSHELICYDEGGQGRSERGPAVPLGLGAWVEELEGLRRALGLGCLRLFGHSYGAFIAASYAVRWPEHVAALVLCAGAPAFDYPDIITANLQARGTPAQQRDFGALLATPPATDEAWRASWRSILPLYLHRADPALIARLDEQTRYAADALAAGLASLAGFDLTPALPALRVPTLAITGRHDWITPPGPGTERLAALVPGARAVVLEQSGHFPFAEEPEAFAAAVGGWLAEVEGALRRG